MAWTNPLDRVPQVPQDWANHVIYGALLAVVLYLVALHSAPTHLAALRAGTTSTLLVAGAKKLADYIKVGPPLESAGVCIGKTIATAAAPLALQLVLAITG